MYKQSFGEHLKIVFLELNCFISVGTIFHIFTPELVIDSLRKFQKQASE